jgi:predicted metal-dependent HD superfamily phosphohydrolase
MAKVEQSDIITAAEDYVRHIFEQRIPSDIYTYHNWVHTTQVRDEVLLLARHAGVTNGELELLNLAALFHDSGFSESYVGHEDVSKRLASEFLQAQNYPPERIEAILRLIEVTKIDVKPNGKLEALMKDADTSSLGKSHFQIYTNSLRKELNTVQNAVLTKKDWAKTNLRFLDDHEYYSASGKERYADKKAENRRLLLEELTIVDPKPDDAKIGKDKKEKKEKGINTIGTSKAAQTQFKTALRNHIDLSSIADNKANIMLSVNALIITFALPLLGKEIADYKLLLLPTIMLLAVCVVSMIFATLATRPIPMKGYSSMESILAKKSNLFFFGNYYNMTFDEYEEGMNATVADDDILDTTIMRDLFFLGKTLGNKYKYLRKCYTIFMYGIIASVITFVIVFALK